MKRKRNNQKQIDFQEMIDRKMIVDFLNTLFTDIEYTMLPISANTDLTATATTNNNIHKLHIEVKNRNVMVNAFNDCFLEVSKYNHLKEDCKNHISIYIAIYPADRVICVWNLDKINMDKIPIRQIEMNEVTYNDEIRKVLKDVYLLPIELSTKYQYNYAFHKQIA
ncbi:hypothetical protein ACMSEZ_05390 [Bacteroides thetaiotaomicron]|uniref:hypothetical protein n=1 Tax=Bacteroides thetaiotaomicron TaxID=818 RepID=UPI0039C1B58F